MSKYGQKIICWSCTAKYYDLNKPNPKCPKCGADPSESPAGVGGGLDDLDAALDDEELEAVKKAASSEEEE